MRFRLKYLRFNSGAIILLSIGTVYVLLTKILGLSTGSPPQSITPANPPLPLQIQSVRRDLPRLQPTFVPPTATLRPTTTPRPTATPVPTATPIPPLPGAGPEMAGELIERTDRYDVYLGYDSLPQGAVAALLPRIDGGLDRAEALLGTRLQARTSLAFYRLGRQPFAGVRALALTEERQAQLFYAPYEKPEGAVRVAIHELAHQLESDRYGVEKHKLADTILHEGLATWLAGDEWLAPTGSSSWRERGRVLRDAGRLRPIRADLGGAAANDVYEGWAAFVDYLIATYGWAAFDDLYRSGAGRYPGSASYQLVYGATLNDLVADWHAWLEAEESS